MTAKVFRSFRDLKLTLGRLDAAHELAELALRHLDDAVPSQEQYEAHVGNLASNYGLHVRPHSSKEAHRVVTLSGITTVHACYEEFLAAFASESLEFGGVDLQLGSRSDGVSKHEHVVAILRRAHLLPTSATFQMLTQVMNLFRLVRNSQAHRAKEAPKELEKLRKQIQDSPLWQQTFPNRPHPSHFDCIGFSDFLLFAQAARDTAECLACQLLPSTGAIARHGDFVGYIGTQQQKLRFLADRFALDQSTAEAVIRSV